MPSFLATFGKIALVLLMPVVIAGGASAENNENIRYELVESSRSIMRVGPNQTLDDLVNQVYAEHEPMWPQIKQKIKELNPQAFNRYTGRLIVGERLKLVTIKKIREIGFRDRLEPVGTVTAIKGMATATDKSGRLNRLTLNAAIYEGDRIKTTADSTVQITMIDGAEMYIKPDSSLRLTAYVLKSGFERGSRSIIDLIKGGLRKVTGAIAANPLSEYRFHTRIITIGVRGTDYVVKLCRENDCNQTASRNDEGSRLHVAVLDGVITLEDEEGVRGELALGQYAVADEEQVVMVDEGKPVPGLLDEQEAQRFQKLQPPAEPSMGIWPWLIGGALFGI